MNKQFPFGTNNLRFSLGQGITFLLLLCILLGNIFYVGFRSYETIMLKNDSNDQDFKKLLVVKQILDKNYLYSKDVPNEQVFDGAVDGLVSSMGDPYTRYISNRDYEEFKATTEGKFGGIGVTIDNTKSNKDGIVISETIKGNSAEMAGIKANDKILSIDGKEVKDMTIEEAIALIRGKVGTTVKLKIKREGVAEPIDIIITRKSIELPVVSHQIIDDKIGYIKYGTFSRTSITQFDTNYQELKNKGIKALIIDLRDNPGGLVDICNELTSRFIGNNKDLVNIQGKNFSTIIKTEKPPYTIDIPVIIIVNENSASASEIFSGAMQDNNRAMVIGQTTFGKGLVQETFPIDEESAIIITISKYLTPKGREINNNGVKPNIEIQQNQEDLLKGIDTQLTESIKEIKKYLNN